MVMTGDYEFHCDDCDTDIIVIGFVPTPRPTRCNSCQWIIDYIPEHERDKVRRLINKDR